MMRIACLTWKFPYYANTYILNELLHINKHHDILIFSREYPDTKINPSFFPELMKKVIYLRDFDNYGFEAIMISKICKILIKNNTSIIHACFGDRSATLAMQLSRITGIPFTFELHAWDLFVGFDNPIEKIKKASMIFTISEYNRKHIITKYNCPSNKIALKRIIINKGYCDTLSSVEKDENLVVTVGRLHPIKGINHSIEAFSKISGKNLRYMIIGDGELTNIFKKQVISLKIADRVIFTGALSNEESLYYIRKASIFVMSSVIAKDGDRDGIPTAMVEAMYLETVPVVSELSGIPEIVKDSYNGLLTQPGDPVNIASSIERLVNDRRLRERLAANAKRTAIEKFDPDNTMGAMYGAWVGIAR